MISGVVELENRQEKRWEKVIQNRWEVLVSLVPYIESLLKLAQIFGSYTVWAASLLATDGTESANDFSRTTELLIPDGTDGKKDKFDTCTKLHQNVLYMCTYYNGDNQECFTHVLYLNYIAS